MPGTQIALGPIPGQLLLLMAIAVGGGLFLRDGFRLFRIMRLGRGTWRGDQPLKRTGTWLVQVIGQQRLLTRPYPGIMHALIFWGFLVITLSTIEQFGRGLWADFRLPLLSGSGLFFFLVDFFQLFVLVGIGMALYRRIRIRPWYLNLSGDAIIILSLITTLMISAFLAEATLYAAAGAPGNEWSFVGWNLSHLFVGLGTETNLALHRVFWWVHVLTLLSFLAYLPHSKHLHIVTAPFNVWLRALAPKGQLPYLNVEEALEQDKPLGASEVVHFTWKDLLDTYTCTECGRCTSQCPASISDKPLSPKNSSWICGTTCSNVAPSSSPEGTQT